jgi:glycosyltransferase involved in cell wall biosynthesis
MNVLHLSTTDSGGAAGAAIRIHRALRAGGTRSRLLVAVKRGSAPDVERLDRPRDRAWAPVWQRLNAAVLRWASRRRRPLFSPTPFTHGGLRHHPAVAEADVICLYWIAGLLSPAAIAALPKPLAWRLSDEWAYTGGCHYAEGCMRFQSACGRCPVLGSDAEPDLSTHGQMPRIDAFSRRAPVIVAPSRWIAGRARASRAFAAARIEHIATGVDTAVFTPANRSEARAALGFNASDRVIAFGAAGATEDPRKGFDLLREALAALARRGEADGVQVVLFGTDAAASLPVPARAFGHVGDEARLARLLAAADACAVPSRADNLPQVALEAIACGTPVVAFDVGGVGDAVRHRAGGWLAPAFDIEDFATGLAWALAAGAPARAAARALAEAEFDLARQTARFRTLLAELAAGAA